MTRKIEVGDFISIPLWNAFGCVVRVEPADIGSDEAVWAQVQEDPENTNVVRYRLEPGQFEFID